MNWIIDSRPTTLKKPLWKASKQLLDFKRASDENGPFFQEVGTGGKDIRRRVVVLHLVELEDQNRRRQ